MRWLWYQIWRAVHPARLPFRSDRYMSVWWALRPRSAHANHNITANLAQYGLRGRNDDGDISTATWKAAQDVSWSQVTDTNFRVRVGYEENAGASPSASVLGQLQYNLNGAGWNNVTASSSVVRASDSPNITQSASFTSFVLTGNVAATAVPGHIADVNGSTGVQISMSSVFVEDEFCVQIRSADVVSGDTIQLRATQDTSGTAFNSYETLPTITVVKPSQKTGVGVSAFSGSSGQHPVTHTRTGSASVGSFFFGTDTWTGTFTDMGTTTVWALAHPFTPDVTSYSGILRATVAVTNSVPLDNFVVSIQSDSSGAPSGTTLWSQSFPASSLGIFTSSWSDLYPFWSVPAGLSAGTQYWVVLSRSGATDDTRFYKMGVGFIVGHLGGDPLTLKRNGSGWAFFGGLLALSLKNAGVSGGGSKTVSTIYTKTGAAIAPFAGRGADAFTPAETGLGVAPFAGGSPETHWHVYLESGSAVSAFSGEVSRAVIHQKSGIAKGGLEEFLFTQNAPASFDSFGWCVAQSEDGSVFVVGSPGRSGIGAVYVYSGQNWGTVNVITPSDGSGGDNFGDRVAISADGSVIAVGAYTKNSSTGAAYVYSGANWSTETKLLSSDGHVGDFFGNSISVSGDGSVIAVGAYGDTSGQGSLYVYSGASWATETKLVASSPVANANFGWSNAISADGSIIVIGADNAGTISGTQGTVFVRTGVGWATETVLSTPVGSQFFGYSVSITADGSAIAVGAWATNTVYVFVGSGWSVRSSISGTGDTRFGRSVSLSPDGDYLAVGSPNSGSPFHSGTVYLYMSKVSGGNVPNVLVDVFSPEGPGATSSSSAGFGGWVSLSSEAKNLLGGASSKSSGRGETWLYRRWGFSGSGVSSVESSGAGETGFVVFELSGRGAGQILFSETGQGISFLSGGGIRAKIAPGSGTGQSVFSAQGGRSRVSSQTGISVATFTGDNEDAFLGSETGTTVSLFSGRGISEFVSGSGNTYGKTGSATTDFSGSGAEADIDVDAGSASAPLAGSGADATIWSKTSTGVAAFAGSATDTDIWTKAGRAEAPFAGAGSDADVFAESGQGVAPFAGAGSRARTLTKTGAAVSVFSGAGAKAVVYAETGSSVSPFSGGGSAPVEEATAGTGVAVFAGSGTAAATSAKSGLAISVFAGGGGASYEDFDSGDAIADFDGAGSRAMVFSKTGSAVAG